MLPSPNLQNTSSGLTNLHAPAVDTFSELQQLQFPFASLWVVRHLRSLFNSGREWAKGRPNEDFSSFDDALSFLRTTPDERAELCSEGKLQGAKLQHLLQDSFAQKIVRPPQALIVSPFLRAERTAEYIVTACGAKVPTMRIDADIREYGAEQTATTAQDLAIENPDRETIASLDLRTLHFFKMLTADPSLKDKDVWLVPHGHWALRFMEALGKTEPDGTPLKSFPNGAMLEFTLGNQRNLRGTLHNPYNFVAKGHGRQYWNQQ